MAALLEYQAKALLNRHGIAVPQGEVVTGADGAVEVARGLGYPLVLKALIPTGKKQRAGAIRFVAREEELQAAVDALIGHSFMGYPATAVLAEERVACHQELFVSFSFDGTFRGPALLLGVAGGVDVEAAAGRGETFIYEPVDILTGISNDRLETAWRQLGLAPEPANSAAQAVARAYEVFRSYDARLLEINPLALTPNGRAVAVGSLFDVDDNALFRQPELAGWVQYGAGRFGRAPTKLEARLMALSAEDKGSVRFMELPGGDVACLLFGGGCSLYSADLFIAAGHRPATYYDGTAPSEALEGAVITGALGLPGVRGLIYGTNIMNQRPVVNRLEHLINVLARLKVDCRQFPVVVRLTGPAEDEARALAATVPGLVYFGAESTIEDAIDHLAKQLASESGSSAGEFGVGGVAQ